LLITVGNVEQKVGVMLTVRLDLVLPPIIAIECCEKVSG